MINLEKREDTALFAGQEKMMIRVPVKEVDTEMIKGTCE